MQYQNEVFFAVTVIEKARYRQAIYYMDCDVVAVLTNSCYEQLFICARSALQVRIYRDGCIALFDSENLITLRCVHWNLFYNRLRDAFQPSYCAFVRGSQCDVVVTADYLLVSGPVHAYWPMYRLAVGCFDSVLRIGGVDLDFGAIDLAQDVYETILVAYRLRSIRNSLRSSLYHREIERAVYRRCRIEDLVPKSYDEYDDLKKLLERAPARYSAIQPVSYTKNAMKRHNPIVVPTSATEQSVEVLTCAPEIYIKRSYSCTKPAVEDPFKVSIQYATLRPKCRECCTYTEARALDYIAQEYLHYYLDRSGFSLENSTKKTAFETAQAFFAAGIHCYNEKNKYVELRFLTADGALLFTTANGRKKPTVIVQLLVGKAEADGLYSFGFEDTKRKKHVFFGDPKAVQDLVAHYNVLFGNY